MTYLSCPQCLLDLTDLAPITDPTQRAQKSRANEQVTLEQRRVDYLREAHKLLRRQR